MATLQELEKRVEAGARFLDKRQPCWECQVDTEDLDISSHEHDIIFQLFGEYNIAVSKLKLGESTWKKGFCPENGDALSMHQESKLLGKLWKDRVKARLKLRRKAAAAE